MGVAVWSAKGGVGVSTVAVMLALGQLHRAEDTLIIDLCGDIAAVLGVEEPAGPGVADWCALDDPTADSLARLEVEVRPGLRYIPRGGGEFGGDPAKLLAITENSARHFIIDCGCITTQDFHRAVVEGSAQRLLVVRPCFLNLRAVRAESLEATGVVLVKERDRSLGLADVESVVAAPVIAQIAVDSSIARSVDAGLARARLPRSLIRTMAKVATHQVSA